MTDADRVPFVQALTMLAETMNEPMSPGRIEGYFVALEDLPIEKVREGIRRAMATCAEFFPKPGKIRELAVPKRESVLNVDMYKPYRPVLEERPALTSPVAMADALTGALALVEGAAEAVRQRDAAAQTMTAEQRADRLALLRAQAKALLLEEPEGSA
jgi:hypothetical protein